MAGRPRAIDDSKVFDVAKPGKSMPVSTSRPVITSQGPPIKDATIINVSGLEEAPTTLAPSVTRKIIRPMSEQVAEPEVAASPTPTVAVDNVVDENELEEPIKTAPMVIKSKIVPMQEATEPSVEIPQEITEPIVTQNQTVEEVEAVPTNLPDESNLPVTETPSDEVSSTESEKTEGSGDPTTTEDNATPDEPTAAVTEDEEEAESATTFEETPKPEEVNTGSETASIDALADAAGKTKDDLKKEDEQAKKEAELQGLIDSKKYVVPLAHDSSKGKNGSSAAVAMLILIILIAGAYAAIDAKIIKTGINLPYHLFKQ